MPTLIPSTDRRTRQTSAMAATPLASATAPAPPPASSDAEFRKSVLTYVACVSSLAVGLATVMAYAPPAPAGGVCDNVSIRLVPKLIPTPKFLAPYLPFLGTDETSTQGIISMWKCATEYQKTNWWFVLFFFELTYLSLKSFAIPATFAMCILAGAIFPLWLSQLLTSTGEVVGSSMCYALSSVMAKPMLERWAADKLEEFRKKAHEERDHLFLFNVFLRLSPFPNWLINASSPIVGNPLPQFVLGTFFGTQLSICFLAQGGSVLKTLGEKGFSITQMTKDMLPVASAMFFLQFIPLAMIRYLKRKKEDKAAAVHKAE